MLDPNVILMCVRRFQTPPQLIKCRWLSWFKTMCDNEMKRNPNCKLKPITQKSHFYFDMKSHRSHTNTDDILVEREKNKLLQEEMEATLHDIQNM